MCWIPLNNDLFNTIYIVSINKTIWYTHHFKRNIYIYIVLLDICLWVLGLGLLVLLGC